MAEKSAFQDEFDLRSSRCKIEANNEKDKKTTPPGLTHGWGLRADEQKKLENSAGSGSWVFIIELQIATHFNH